MVLEVDVSAIATPEQIGEALAKIVTVDGCSLRSVQEIEGDGAHCSLSSAEIKRPILLSDGSLCDESAFHLKLQLSGRNTSPASLLFQREKILKLDPLKAAFEHFLQAAFPDKLQLPRNLDYALHRVSTATASLVSRAAAADHLEACISEMTAWVARAQAQILEAKARLEDARGELQARGAVRIQSAVRAMQTRRLVAHLRIKLKLDHAVSGVMTPGTSLRERVTNMEKLEACISENAARFGRTPGAVGHLLEAKAILEMVQLELRIAGAVRIQSAVKAMQARRRAALLQIERESRISLAMQGFFDRLPQEGCDTLIVNGNLQEGPISLFDDIANVMGQCGADVQELVAAAIFDRMVTLPHLGEAFVTIAFRLNAQWPGLCQLLVDRIHRDLGVLVACIGVLGNQAAVDGCAPAPRELANLKQQEKLCAILALSGHFYIRDLLPLEGLDSVVHTMVGIWSAPQVLPEGLVKGLCFLLEVAAARARAGRQAHVL